MTKAKSEEKNKYRTYDKGKEWGEEQVRPQENQVHCNLSRDQLL